MLKPSIKFASILLSDTKLILEIFDYLKDSQCLWIVMKEVLLSILYFPMQIEHLSPGATNKVPFGFQTTYLKIK